MILSNSYCGCFYSILALPEFEPPIDTVQQLEALVLADKVRVFTYANSSYLDSFIFATPDLGPLHTIGLLINRTMGDTFMIYEDEDLITQTETPLRHNIRRVGVASSLQLAFTRRVYSHRALYIGSEALSSDNSGFIFAKRSAFFEPFDRLYGVKVLFESLVCLTGVCLRFASIEFNRQPKPVSFTTGRRTPSTELLHEIRRRNSKAIPPNRQPR